MRESDSARELRNRESSAGIPVDLHFLSVPQGHQQATSATREVKDVIAALDLVPHPEKGYYIETLREKHTISDGCARSTCIYYLLEGVSARSHLHSVHDVVEVWH
ncbi:unnamed protein product [Penicillium salamii]|uniref:DUF985 domain-containing protein n=1 Tax=Penicillium salamii TaxID=1612424 RepID=A0A9W4I790_9EURO|nr:unnamed protein product [Penicillium salamii]